MKYILFFITFVLLTACTEKQSDGIDANAVQGAPVVIASNYPLYFFTQKIAGDVIDVRFPEIDGDPAMWAPGGQQSADLQKADLLILNGAGYESWLAFTTLPGGQLLDTTTNVQAMLLPIENEAIHQHGPASRPATTQICRRAESYHSLGWSKILLWILTFGTRIILFDSAALANLLCHRLLHFRRNY